MSAASVAVEIVVGVIPAVGGSYWAYKASTRASKISAVSAQSQADTQARTVALQVEADAYVRAKGIYEGAVEQLEHQLDRLQEQLNRVNDQLALERDTSNALRMQVRELETQVATLEQTVSDMRRMLARAPIDAAGNAAIIGPFTSGGVAGE